MKNKLKELTFQQNYDPKKARGLKKQIIYFFSAAIFHWILVRHEN